MFEDLKDTFDAVFPRAMVIGFALFALLALGSLSAKASAGCKPMLQGYEWLQNEGVEMIAKGLISPETQNRVHIYRRLKDGVFLVMLSNVEQDRMCLEMSGTELEILKNPVSVPKPKAKTDS